ncbi:hypothetical protein GGR46_005077 [Sphingomonas kyeonggiensis]|uniref:Uncharacterized protein n=1 Tax=Sphingomonas kyeonggiensis TaxID=1268553 RepID=A0A7W6NZJ6_9SPHN|nr:hypothetical protein [Sphingomonas kyeonggiensis]
MRQWHRSFPSDRAPLQRLYACRVRFRCPRLLS